MCMTQKIEQKSYKEEHTKQEAANKINNLKIHYHLKIISHESHEEGFTTK